MTEGEDASYASIGETGALVGIVTGSEIEVLEGAGVIGYYGSFDGEPKNEKVLFAQFNPVDSNLLIFQVRFDVVSAKSWKCFPDLNCIFLQLLSEDSPVRTD